MNQNRPLKLAGLLEDIGQHAQVVSLQRADVGEAEGLEKHTGREETFEGVLAAPGVFRDVIADLGDLAHDVLSFLLEALHPSLGKLAAQKRRQGPDVAGDGHLVVVEDHDEVLAKPAGLVQALVGQARGHGAVADDGHDLVVQMRHVPGRGHAQSRGN